MKKTKLATLFLAVALPVMALTLAQCGGDDDDEVTPKKTLDKNKLIGKKWYDKGSSSIHDFKTGGVYKTTGTWKWINNSDTMEIVPLAGEQPEKWKFYWSADKEMACNLAGDPGEILYKDQPW